MVELVWGAVTILAWIRSLSRSPVRQALGARQVTLHVSALQIVAWRALLDDQDGLAPQGIAPKTELVSAVDHRMSVYSNQRRHSLSERLSPIDCDQALKAATEAR